MSPKYSSQTEEVPSPPKIISTHTLASNQKYKLFAGLPPPLSFIKRKRPPLVFFFNLQGLPIFEVWAGGGAYHDIAHLSWTS